MIVVADYDPNWPALFESLKNPIWKVVADFAIAVEHVGSTSVPGLAAKPIIDMDVIVPNGKVVEGIGRLEKLGYQHKGDLGIPFREAFRRPAGTVAHNLYLCPSGCLALSNHLALRDHLRANANAAQAYSALKKRLAIAHSNDIDAYIEAKTEFIVSILRQTGVGANSLTEIEAVNAK